MSGNEADAKIEITQEMVQRAAELLHSKMEHLDPSEKPSWSLLDERDRDFYETCAEAVLSGIFVRKS